MEILIFIAGYLLGIGSTLAGVNMYKKHKREGENQEQDNFLDLQSQKTAQDIYDGELSEHEGTLNEQEDKLEAQLEELIGNVALFGENPKANTGAPEESGESGETKYRTIYHKNYLREKWLQYKDSEGNWRCVTEETTGKVLGSKYGCITDISKATSNQIGCYEGGEGGLKSFVKMWPQISKYFKYLDEIHSDYKREKEEKRAKNGEIEKL